MAADKEFIDYAARLMAAAYMEDPIERAAALSPLVSRATKVVAAARGQAVYEAVWIKPPSERLSAHEHARGLTPHDVVARALGLTTQRVYDLVTTYRKNANNADADADADNANVGG